MQSIVIEREGKLDAYAQVDDVRDFCDDLVVFDLNGKILVVRAQDGKLAVGDTIQDHMAATEWTFLRRNCLSYANARILVNTKGGAMLVFCHMVASVHIMIGVIVKADRAVVSAYCRRHVTMVDRISPRMLSVRPSEPTEAAFNEIDALLSPAFSALATASMRRDLSASILGATSYVIRRICLLARLVGCRVNCRSVREFAPYVEDFNADAFVAVMLHILLFIYNRCPSRAAEIEIADFDARPRIVVRCEMPEEGEILINRRYRYAELDYCDSLAAERSFPFDCVTEGMGTGLRVSFCPKIRYVDGLHVKVPIKAIDYSGQDSIS